MSNDGINWISSESGTHEQLNSVTSNGLYYIAVGGNGTVLTSTTGVFWIKQYANTKQSFGKVSNINNRIFTTGGGASVFVATLVKS